jgi:acid phosphatase (class A)
MKFAKLFLLPTLALVLLSTLAAAKDKAAQALIPWVLPDQGGLLVVVPAPPPMGSAAEKADLDGVIALQSNPSPEVLAHAEKTVGFNVFSFAEVLGPGFTAEAYPKTSAFFDRLEATVNQPKNFLKDFYHRVRPYRAFPDQVRELVTKEDGYSYPSGHSTRAWLYALVLGALDPDHRNAFLASAMQVCQDRVIGGMHYPSDVLESRVLAEEVFRELLANKAFMFDLEQLHKAEWMGKSTSH